MSHTKGGDRLSELPLDWMTQVQRPEKNLAAEEWSRRSSKIVERENNQSGASRPRKQIPRLSAQTVVDCSPQVDFPDFAQLENVLSRKTDRHHLDQ